MSQQHLVEALHALYHGSPEVKEQANHWLEQWQQSPEAWAVSHEVLQMEAAGMEAHYFCAQTLRTKASGAGAAAAAGCTHQIAKALPA